MERTRAQLQRLWLEQRAEQQQLKKLDAQISDAQLIEEQARRRAQRQQDMLENHRQRATEVEHKIAKLREELEGENSFRQRDDTVRASSTDQQAQAAMGFRVRSAPSLGCAEGTGGRSPWIMPKTGPDTYQHRLTGGPVERHLAWTTNLQPRSAPTPGEESLTWQDRLIEARHDDERTSWDLEQDVTVKDYFDMVEAKGLHNSTSSSSFSKSTPSWSTSNAEQSKLSQRARIGKQVKHRKADSAAVAEERELLRERIRQELISAAGGAHEAFQKLDLTGSGNISLQEFADGVSRSGVNWKGITGLEKRQDLFKLFDMDKDGVVNFAELFPEEAARKIEPEWHTAEAFWSYWFQQNSDFKRPFRSAKWQPSTSEEELQCSLEASEFMEDVAAKKKWMSATIRRLKKRGKSDGRCREIVALHLPAGTGPKDREDVKAFSRMEVRACKKRYTDAWMDPVKNIQKTVVEMRDFKRDLRALREELSSVTEGRGLRSDEDARRLAMAALGADRANSAEGGWEGSRARTPEGTALAGNLTEAPPVAGE